VHRNTTFRWRHHFLDWIKQDKPNELHGITVVDETYLPKGSRNLTRASHQRGEPVSKRGISNELVCILLVRERSIIGKGPITKVALATYLKPVIDSDTLLVSDGNPIYSAFCKSENISHEAVNLSQGQRGVRGAYHVQNVNAYHSHFKNWLVRFHGMATKYLPNYLGSCRVMEHNRNLTPEILLNSALGNFQYLTVT